MSRRGYRAGHRVLLDGDGKRATGCSPACIDQKQAEVLLAFLRREIVNPAGYELIPALERRLAAPHPPAD